MDTPRKWQKAGCPKSHMDAYKVPVWRKVIEAECRMVAAQAHFEEALLKAIDASAPARQTLLS